MDNLNDKLKLLPNDPGVYVMLDKNGVIIYVGKAKNLKNRVRQYFFNGVKTNKVMAMVNNIADFYYIIVPSEIDALSLENNLIKKHKPRYNILLKDDKTYPYLRVDLKEEFPTFTITRRIRKDGAKYFGPYMGGVSVRDVLEIINLAFSVRGCTKKITGIKAQKPCLNYHLKRCLAPCALMCSREEYLARVNMAIAFLSGDVANTEKLLTQKMQEASLKEEFELALKYRDKIASLEKLKIKRLTALNKFISADVIAHSSNGIYSTVNMLIVRNGITLGSKNFSFESATLSSGDAIFEFINQYYKDGIEFPEEIICGEPVSDARLLEEFFKQKYQKSPLILHVKAGVRRALYDMAKSNSEEHLSTAVDRIKHKHDMTHNACLRLQQVLNLKNYPKRMECFDISNISGVDKVGSMVVFTDGEKDSKQYRRFKIKTVAGIDDYESHKEMMRRRLLRLKTEPERFAKPDLVIIDGGKGQLSSVKEVFDEFEIDNIDLISLAERNEEVYTLYQENPIIFERSDYCLRLLQRIRDEAHRFAVTYHRSLRDKHALVSVLDSVKGLGKVKKQALIEYFKDINGIIKADKAELTKVSGIGEKQAELIIKKFTEEGLK